jgi:tRNA(fMet)-specific endonuclease VapC
VLILDTDHFSELLRNSDVGNRLGQRLAELKQPPATTIVTLEEQARGWLSRIKQADTDADLIQGYGRLHRLFTVAGRWTVLEWDPPAMHTFNALEKQRLRIGTMDLRIASIALSREATLLTRNQRDFNRVPGLTTQNWL